MQFQFDGIHFPALNDFVFYYYGAILMLGVAGGGFLAAWHAQQRGQNPNEVWDLLTWLLIGGIIGARLWHVFTPSPSAIAQGITTEYYLTHPFDLLNLRRGGLGIPGAVLGGAVALFFFTRSRRLSFAQWADIAAPALALGQAIGRWGNYFNQELYGAPTDLPWKLYIDPAHRLTGFEQFSYYHPLFLYESLWSLGNMFLLLWLSRRFAERLRPGSLFLVYLILYPSARFLLDFLRLDASALLGVNANQTFMAAVAATAALVLLWRQKPWQNPHDSVSKSHQAF